MSCSKQIMTKTTMTIFTTILALGFASSYVFAASHMHDTGDGVQEKIEFAASLEETLGYFWARAES